MSSLASRTILAATHRGIARASAQDVDAAWSVESHLTDYDVRCLAADPAHPQTVYAGTQNAGVLRSDDGGQTWRTMGLTGYQVKSLVVSRAVPDTIYAGTRPALVFVSHDGGASWKELTAFRSIRSRWLWFSPAEKPFTAYVQALALSPDDPGVIVAGIEAGAVVRSEDGGKTWSGHRSGALRDCHSLAYHPQHSGWVYEGGGTGAGVSVSRDAGATWAQPRGGLDRHYGWAVAADRAHPEVWYASLSPGPTKAHSANNAQAFIFRATGGADWQKLSGGLPQPLNAMPYALLTDPTHSGHVYAGLSNGQVWHSADYGDTWGRLAFDLPAIRSMVLLKP
jgi:BNR/Asp-box repeat